MTQRAFKMDFDEYRMTIHKENHFRKRSPNLRWAMHIWLAQEWPYSVNDIVNYVTRKNKTTQCKQ